MNLTRAELRRILHEEMETFLTPRFQVLHEHLDELRSGAPVDCGPDEAVTQWMATLSAPEADVAGVACPTLTEVVQHFQVWCDDQDLTSSSSRQDLRHALEAAGFKVTRSGGTRVRVVLP